MVVDLPASWSKVLASEVEQPYFKNLCEFVDAEAARGPVYPPEAEVFQAFKQTPLPKVKVVLLGQDPYHDEGQAHGLCFSVRPGVKLPPSLRNMFKELESDIGCAAPKSGCLEPWAKQGVLMLNAVLTVRAHEANSHKDRGWERFTDAAIQAVAAKSEPVIFLLWGAYAQKKGQWIDPEKHHVLKSAHPSPLSARKFFGSRPFSKTNAALAALGVKEINWCLPMA